MLQKFTFIICLLLVLGSCQETPDMKTDGGIRIVVELDAEGYSKSELEKVRTACVEIFRKRLENFYGYAPTISADSDPSRIRIEVAGARNEQSIARLLTQTADLRFCETFTFAELDPSSSNLFGSYGDRSTIGSLYAPPSTDAHLPVIAHALARDTARINQLLSEQETRNHFGSSVQFLWGAEPINQQGVLELIAVRARSKRHQELTSNLILSAEIIKEEGEVSVSIRFTERGAEKWKQLTENNVNRCIAIVMDNRVYSNPLVMEPITSGETVISGNFTKEEASNLASLLNAGSLPIGAKIVSIKAVRGKGK